MKKSLKISIFILTVLFSVSGFYLFASGATDDDPYNLKMVARETGVLGDSTPKTIPEIFGSIVGVGLSLVSVLFFGLMIYGGVIWMLSQGDESESKKALSTIFGAIVGILIVLSAYTIVNFIFSSVQDEALINPQLDEMSYTNSSEEGLDPCEAYTLENGCVNGEGYDGSECVWENYNNVFTGCITQEKKDNCEEEFIECNKNAAQVENNLNNCVSSYGLCLD